MADTGQGLSRRYPEAEDQLHDLWNSLVDDFCAIDFVHQHHQWDLETALHLTGDFSFDRLRKIADSWIARKLFSSSDNYRESAYGETYLQEGQARYVVYGHTHLAEQTPLDLMPPTTGGVTEPSISTRAPGERFLNIRFTMRTAWSSSAGMS